MLTIRRHMAVLAIICAIAIGIFAGKVWAEQVHMVNARQFLNQALSELGQAKNNKGGHKVQAENLINQAINQINLGIKAAN